MMCKTCGKDPCVCGGKKCGSGHCTMGWIAKILLIVGGLNWGLVGLGGFAEADWNVVHMLLGNWPAVEWIVYILVGVVAVVKIFGGCKCHKCASACGSSCGTCKVDGGSSTGGSMSSNM